jgi:hypothetical protein
VTPVRLHGDRPPSPRAKSSQALKQFQSKRKAGGPANVLPPVRAAAPCPVVGQAVVNCRDLNTRPTGFQLAWPPTRQGTALVYSLLVPGRGNRLVGCEEDYEAYAMLIPTLTLQNYADVFSERVIWETYFGTLKFCLVVWAITLVLGCAIAYFLAFYVRTLTWQMTLFLVCTVPFWTSNGALNTLPLEFQAMQGNATTPVIYALGTLMTGLSFLVIGASLAALFWLRARRARLGSDAGKGTI